MSDTEPRSPASPPLLARWLHDVAAALRFFSRLPVPSPSAAADAHAMPRADDMARVLPLAGLVIALPGALVLAVAAHWSTPPLAAAGLAVAVSLAVTGALHEDGLADVADGFGAYGDAGRRLAIMADSRIGTFGACALVLALVMRTALLAALLERAGPLAASAAALAAAAISRIAMMVPLWRLPSARPGGRSDAMGRPGDTAMATGAAIAAILVLSLGTPIAGAGHALAALLGPAIVGLAMAAWTRRALGGQTGDVAGATQALAEIAALLALAAGA